MPRMPIGMLIKKIQRHRLLSTSRPPRIGPSAGATTSAMPKIPSAVPCSLGGKVLNSIAEPSGCAMPPPNPCSARAAMSSQMLDRKAGRKPHSSEPIRKAVRPPMYMRLMPKRSARKPDSGVPMPSAST